MWKEVIDRIRDRALKANPRDEIRIELLYKKALSKGPDAEKAIESLRKIADR
jgi:hypothetical protein